MNLIWIAFITITKWRTGYFIAGKYNMKLDLAFNNFKPKDWYFVLE